MDEKRLALINATLACAKDMDWQFVSLQDIADQASVKLSDVHALFECKEDILMSYGRYIDSQVMEAFQGQELEGDSVKDKLFDILMERFDLLNDDREAVLSIMKAYQFDPKRAMLALPHVAKSMNWMLELAGQNTSGWRGCIKVMGLTALYLDIAMRVWAKDEGDDLPKTMSALDKSLSFGESAANSLML